MSRLPEPGQDDGRWGDILNDYLLAAHNADGTIKANAVTSASIAPNSITSVAIAPQAVTSSQLASNSVSAAAIVNGTITATLLSSDVRASLANADAAVIGTAPDASTATKGLIKLAGVLGGAADAPTLASGVITDVNISSTAAISQTKVSGLATALIAKADTSSLAAVATSGSYDDLANKPVIPTIPVASVAGKTGVVTLTPSDVGLGNVANTSDVAKPVSSATQTALNTKADTSSLATVATTGSYMDLANKPVIPTIPVTSVAGRTGAVTLTSADIGLDNINNTSDANKPVSMAQAAAIANASLTIANLPPNSSTYNDYVFASTNAYPARPTARTDIIVIWRGPTAPAIGGTGNAVAGKDEWEVKSS